MAVFFVACHSRTDTVSARTRLAAENSEPKRFGSINLKYVDTNSAEWQEIIARLDSFYRVQVRAGFNGSVLVGYQGQVLYQRHFGFANREKGQKLTPNSAVQLASVTKTFTGAAILYLYQNKYLNIDDPVQTYLKSFPYKDITVRMLLNHRSGLPDYLHWYQRYGGSRSKPVYNNKILQLMALNKPKLQFKPDTRFDYSNTNYVLLASIIEEVSEMPYSQFMKRYIFEPLGMKNTFVYDPAQGLPANATISYKANWVREPDMFADGVYGDKGIYSTPEDMYRWDQSFYEGRLLNNETMELSYGPCSFERPGIKNYGLGWRMLCYPDGYKVIYHNGWWHGNNTSFYRFIKDNFTIVVLGNKYNSGIYRQAPVVYNILKKSENRSDFDTGE